MYLLLLSVAVTNAAPTNSNPVINKRSSYGGPSLPYAEEVYRPNKYEEIIEEKVYKNPIKYEEIIEKKIEEVIY
jgi:hypothetical protein